MIKRANYQMLSVIQRYETQTDEGRAQAKAAAEELARKQAAEEAERMRRQEAEAREQWLLTQDRIIDVMRLWQTGSMRLDQMYQTHFTGNVVTGLNTVNTAEANED